MSTIAKRTTRNRKIRSEEQMESKIENIDFKMVTFTLAGKDYGIDIMKIKEIAKFVNFTYVPNTPPFVKGVYNLRGEIISIIDLREMFNLPFDDDDGKEEENGLILRLENNMIGVVVDKIDKVIGISSETIQPPHPIFGDINIKYISGVVENDGRLYIILDVERVLGGDQAGKEEEKRKSERAAQEAISRAMKADVPTPQPQSQSAPAASAPAKGNDEVNQQFVRETLSALAGFQVSRINQDWFSERFAEWKAERGAENIQLQNANDADHFLRGFSSRSGGRLWDETLFKAVSSILPPQGDSQMHVWNPGCGKGYETYSLAVLLKKKYPGSRIKIWASDKDLLSVSGAPNLLFAENQVPAMYREFMVEGPNGLSFNQEIKDAILFEYHDIANAHTMPPIQLMVARDLFSYLPLDLSTKIFEELDERMKPGGIIMLGDNETVPSNFNWTVQSSGNLKYHTKK